MYQRAVKIARVLEESERETQALNLEKRRRELTRSGFQGREDKGFRPNHPPGKGKRPMFGPPNYPPCQIYGRYHTGNCSYGDGRCFECGERGYKWSECLKLGRGQNRVLSPTGPPITTPCPSKATFFSTPRKTASIWHDTVGQG